MKRKALLAITNCATKAFETYSARGFLPFGINDRNWSEYTIENAFSLKILMAAAESTDLNSAAKIAGAALHSLHPINPFAYAGDEELWVGLVRYCWEHAPEGWDCRTVVAGRWCDLAVKAERFVSDLGDKASVTSIQAVSATRAADAVLIEAREFGLPEGEAHSVPEDLTGYPNWFIEAEMKRRRLLFAPEEGRK